jgi:hypothetical protein
MSENVPTRQGWQIAEAVQEYRGTVADDLFVTYADHARIVAEMEQAHAAALAEAYDKGRRDAAEMKVGIASRVLEQRGYKAGIAAAAPRTLTADDPEPAVGSVVLDRNGDAWQYRRNAWYGPGDVMPWWELLADLGPVRLIHDGGAA